MVTLLAWVAGTSLSYQTATLDITPPELLPLGGYTARKGKVADAGGQPLMARVVVLGDLTLVAVDMLTVPEDFFREVQKRSECPGLWIVATHTHCAPDSQMLNPKMTMVVPGIAAYSPLWYEWYVDRVVSAIQKARSMPKTPIRRLTLTTAHLHQNRGRRPGARPDRTGWLLSADGRPLLASYAAHATLFEESWNKTDGDWPGLLANRLKAVVVPGPIGDVSPVAKGRGPVEKCRNFVDNFRRVMAQSRVMGVWPERDSWGQAQAVSALDPPVPHPTFAAKNKVPESLAKVVVGRFAQTRCSVQVAHFGKFLIVGLPGEPSSALGRRIQAEARRLSFPHCLVVSHVNGWVGYVLEPADYDRGGYEATLSFNGRRTSQRLFDAASSQIKALRDRWLGRGSATAGS